LSVNGHDNAEADILSAKAVRNPLIINLNIYWHFFRTRFFMLKHYFSIAFRQLWRNKAFTAINISGLAIGIATCLVIMLFVIDELSYDRFNEKADRIVRVVFKGVTQGQQLKESNVMPEVAAAMRANFPEVQDATRFRYNGYPRITLDNNKTFSDNPFAFADPNVFSIFTFPFIQGNPEKALAQPNTVVITESLARKYFGAADPMGKVLTLKDWNATFKVTGVMRDIPANAHFHFDLLASMTGLEEAKSTSWLMSNFYTYLLLPQGYDHRKLEAKLPALVKKYIGPQLPTAMGMSLEDFEKKGNWIAFFLQPLTSIHLHSDMTFELGPRGDIRYVYIFGAIALFMLLIACINFMNLSTASASRRAREVGVRKAMGSLKQGLIWQFLLESLLLTAISMLLALFLARMALPFFNELAGKNLSLNVWALPWLLPGLLALGLVTGVLAGSYPAFHLSSFKPVVVLKGTFTGARKGVGLRGGLVVFQFFISIALIVSTIVVYKQLTYIQQKELGYNRERVIVLPSTWWLGKNSDVFRNQLLQHTSVADVSTSGYLPAGPSDNNNFFVHPDGRSLQLVKTLRYEVDDHYIPTLGITMAAGRNFSPEYGSDSSAIIINETAAKAFGWGADFDGHTLTRSDVKGNVSEYHVIGIVKDFHFHSLRERISPLVMTLGSGNGAIIVKTKTGDVAGLLAFMKKQWDRFSREEPFNYAFMNDRFNDTYIAEQTTGRILGIFSGLTIFVACLGLFGLAMFTAERRTKEIGIRKVLGASTAGIAGMLSKDFLKLVLVANLLAWPLAWWAMNKWLQDFAYRIQLHWWMFALAGIAAVLIAVVTVSFQAIKAALANPVNSLKAE
jgi:putative ABC transport system permease protein